MENRDNYRLAVRTCANCRECSINIDFQMQLVFYCIMDVPDDLEGGIAEEHEKSQPTSDQHVCDHWRLKHGK
jgi:hypothetical protein